MNLDDWYTPFYNGRIQIFQRIIHIGVNDIGVKKYTYDRKTKEFNEVQSYLDIDKTYFEQKLESKEVILVEEENLEELKELLKINKH